MNHLRKLRQWLDAHPDHVSWAGIGLIFALLVVWSVIYSNAVERYCRP